MIISPRSALVAAALAVVLFPSRSVAESVVSEWNEQMLAAIRAGAPRPTVVSRSMYLVSASVYDAWAAYDGMALASAKANRTLRRPAREHTEAHRRHAVSQAAYRALLAEFPSQRPRFDDFLASLGYAPSDSMDPSTPDGIGNLAALGVLESRRDDGSNASKNFADTRSATYVTTYVAYNSANPTQDNYPGHAGFDGSRWQPLRVPNGSVRDADGEPVVDPGLPSSYADQRFLTPHWGGVRTFAAGDPRQFLPPAPPLFGSSEPYVDALGQRMSNDEAWKRQVEEVLTLSATLDDRGKVIAEFWADGPRSETPPGHWNQLAQGVSVRDAHLIGDDARMFFALNAALLDASIVTWHVKRTYDSIRPVSAIRHLYHGVQVPAWAGPDLGTRMIPGDQWRPYQDPTFVTPPFPEFTSGHSAFSAAAAEVLTRFTGREDFHDGVTRIGKDINGDGVEDFLGEHLAPAGSNRFESGPAEAVTLRWPTFKDAADEAGYSRLYGGIHIQDGDLHGRRIGERVGAKAMAKAQSLFAGQLPIDAGFAGTWTAPGRDGEALLFDVLADGRVTAAWLTYDYQGRQVWLAGAGDAGVDGTATIALSITRGPRFGSYYDEARLDARAWGEIELRFTGCDDAQLSYASPLSGYSSGTHALQRLTRATGTTCVD